MAILKNVKGSTIIEVIVAMVIILSSLCIGMSIFSNLSRDINDELQIIATIRINSWANESKLKNNLSDSTWEFENLTLHRTLLPYQNSNKFKVLNIEAYTKSDKKITDYQEIIIVN